jgi:presenilin-like A22 family membrane protease
MAVMGAVFVLAIIAALMITPLFVQQDVSAVEDEEDPVNPLIYLGFILLFTLFVLMAVRAGMERLIQLVILGVVAMTIYIVLDPLLQLIPGVGPGAAGAAGAVAGLALAALLYAYPEWWVVDAAGFVVAAGVCALLGVSFSIGPVILMLAGLAIYDAVAVYRTGHMVDLADSMVSLRLPILFIVPKSLEYSYLEQKSLSEQLARGEERGALFMGLGDIIIPGALCVSALAFLPHGAWELWGLEVALPLGAALGTLAGASLGFVALMWYVASGRPQAGLPLLNGGALAGYAISYLALYQDLSMGISFSL